MANVYLHNIGSASSEMDAAISLKQLMDVELADTEGRVWIVPSIDIHPATGRHDVDLIMIGYLSDYYIDSIAGKCNIEIRSFFATIEIKSHSGVGLKKEGTHLLVKYPSGYEDVTTQSNDQNTSIRSFLSGPLQQESIRVPFISNLIWLTGTDRNDFNDEIGLVDSNILVSDSTAKEFFVAIGRQYHLVDNGFVNAFGRCGTEETIEFTANIFCAKSNGADTMTLRRINILNTNNNALLDLEKDCSSVIILSGHAGTGKTVMLMQGAINMTKKGYKCLFLTYNRALIADLKHTMRFFGNSLPAFDIDSMSSFMIGLMRKAGIWKNTFDIKSDFDQSMAVLMKVKESKDITPVYDYIFVDEAQDWKTNEAEILKYYYRDNHIVIADGIDQFMKTSEHTFWGPIAIPKLKQCLRQRSNLVSFAKIFASKLGVYWDVDSTRSLPGGKVIITNAYNKNLHERLFNEAVQHGCSAYDLMLLAPNSLTKTGHFDLIDAYNAQGIHLYDGVDSANRDSLYSDVNYKNKECRVYTYESCRGLEAWITVCLRFDELFTEPHPHDYHEIQFSPARQYMLSLWSLIPLTRAVDTLVLGVQKGSTIDTILREIACENPDFVTIEEK